MTAEYGGGGKGIRGEGGTALPVSLCMIVRNESRFLADCLSSAAPYVAEMIVVDTGSTDDTVAIGAACGARVLHAAWTDDFAAARNISLAAAAQPWILVLDADERLAVGSLAEWSGLLGDAAKWGYFVRVNSRVGSGSGAGTVTDAVCRLFRNDLRVRFRGLVHEETASAIYEAFGDEAVGYAEGLEIWHEGYRDDIIAERDKFARNRRLLARALAVDPEDPALRYAVGAELFAAGDYGSALTWLEPLASMESDPGYGSDVILKIIHACRAVGRLADAAKYAADGVERYWDFADLHEARSETLLALDEPLPALRSAAAALSAGPAPICYSTAAGAGTYRSLGLAGLALERLYRFREAAEAYVSAIRLRADYAPAWQRLLLLGQLDAPRRAFWREASEAAGHAWRSKSEAEGLRTSFIGNELTEWLCDLGLPEEAESVWLSLGEAVVDRSPGVLAEGLWLVQRGEMEEGRRIWDAAYEAGDADAGRLAVYAFALALREGEADRASFLSARQMSGATASAARAALAACAGAERAMPVDAAGSAILAALLRLGAVPAWLRLHAGTAQAAPARPILRAVPPLRLAALLQGAPASQRLALRAALAAGGAGLPPAAAAPHRLAAGWAAAAGGAWQAAAADFAAALTEGARPWQRRAAAAGLAAAGAAAARAAGSPRAGGQLPALFSEAALPLILGTAVLPPG